MKQPNIGAMDEMQQAIIEGLKEQLAEEIHHAREEFCSKLMMAGLSAARVRLIENHELVGDELQYSVSAVYRSTGETVDLENIKPASPEDYELWYAGLTDAVKAVADAYPATQTYHLAGNTSPVQLYAFNEDESGEVIITICVHDPIQGPYVMQGVKPSQLTRHVPRK